MRQFNSLAISMAVELNTTEETVTIKPDDKANATLTFDRIAIHKILPRGGDSADGGLLFDAGKM